MRKQDEDSSDDVGTCVPDTYSFTPDDADPTGAGFGYTKTKLQNSALDDADREHGEERFGGRHDHRRHLERAAQTNSAASHAHKAERGNPKVRVPVGNEGPAFRGNGQRQTNHSLAAFPVQCPGKSGCAAEHALIAGKVFPVK